MLYGHDKDFYLFTYDRLEDSSAVGDLNYETPEEIYEICQEEYNIDEWDWQDIADPCEHCQHDWIAPVRVKGRQFGKPEWGKLEKLTDGKWIEIKEMKK